jgi:hypothetical protein
MADTPLKQCVINKFRGRFWADRAIIRQLRGYIYNRAYINNPLLCIVFDNNGQLSTHYPLHHDRRLNIIIYSNDDVLSAMDENTYFGFCHENSPDTTYEIYRVNVDMIYNPDVYVLYQIVAGNESLAAIILRVGDLRALVNSM